MSGYKTFFLTEEYINQYITLFQNQNYYLLKNKIEAYVKEQNEYSFIFLVFNQNNQICYSAKINYIQKFSAYHTFDVYIQDLFLNPNIEHNLPIPLFAKDLYKLLVDFESRYHYNIHKRILLLHTQLQPYQRIFEECGFIILLE